MGFVPFSVVPKGSPSGSGFGASLTRSGQGETPAKLTFFLSPATAAELGWSGDDRLEVLLGQDEQHGLIRLRKSEAGTAIVTKRGAIGGAHFFQIALGHVDQFVNRSEGKKWCGFYPLEDGWTEIVLPKWADETGIKRVRLPGPPPKPSAGRLPGDPPPGRSALEQKTETRGDARRKAERREEPDFRAAEQHDRAAAADVADRLADMTVTFGLTATEALYLREFMDGRLKSKDALFQAAHGEDQEIKLVDVFVHKLRKKLQSRLVEIETVWGQGYRMTPPNVARVMVLINANAPRSEPSREEDEAELERLAAAGDGE